SRAILVLPSLFMVSCHTAASGWRAGASHAGDSRRSLARRGFDQLGTPSACLRRGCDRLPPTAAGSIQPDNIEQFGTMETHKMQFGSEQVACRTEHLQVGIEAHKKTLIREDSAVLLCPDQQCLLHTLLPGFVVADQRV